ncbi:MAG: SurA N-terminal domain-containing protein [Alphaproteobacteria bacterium]|nr:SurA N-terminal domain-containing protein [Alphaproteobacteria bacterium]
MMDSMRNAAKSWMAKLLIGLLAVSFAVWGIADVFRGFNQGALATVGDTEVTAQEFNVAFNQYLQNLTRQTGQAFTPEDARKLGLDRSILNNLIQSAAIDDQARSLKLGVSDQFIADETAANPAFQDGSGKFDPEQFRRLLAANGFNEATYLARERKDRLREAITGSAEGSFAVPATLTEALYRHRNEQRDARYFAIATAESEVAAPTDEDIAKEYESNPQAYTAPEYRSIAILKAEPGDVAATITLSDQEIAAGYEKYRSDYTTPERRTILQLAIPNLDEANKIKERLAAGEDFIAVAKELGFTEADITFADKAKTDFFDPAIREAAFALAEGAVSDPVKGALTTVILKAVSVKPEHQSTLDEVKMELSERLKLDRAREEIQSIFDTVEDQRAAQAKFEDIAAKASIPFQLVVAIDAAGLGKDGKPVDVPHKTELLRAAFSSDVGVENDTLSLDDGYIWYEVREVIPSALRPLDDVKEKARSAVFDRKLRDLSTEKAKRMVERAGSGISLEDLARETRAEIKTVQGLKRGETNSGFDAAAVRAVFSVPEGGFTYALDPDGKGVRVIQSMAVLLPPFDANAADAKNISSEVIETAASDMLSSYLGGLQKQVGVSLNEALWRQISGTTSQ